MSKELDIQIDVFNEHSDVQIGVLNRLQDIGIDVGSGGGGPNTAKIEVRTTAEWNTMIQYIPPANRIIVYADKSVIDGTPIPGIKIADGLSYVVDLPFVSDDIAAEFVRLLGEHVTDRIAHVTEEERNFWNNKINYALDESQETLIINRD